NFLGRSQRGTAFVAEFLRQLLQFGLDDLPQAPGRSQDRGNFGRLLLFRAQLLDDVVDFELRNAIQLQLQYRQRLLEIERKGLHQLRSGILLAVAGADDLQGPIKTVEDDLETLQNVQPPLELRQQILVPSTDRVEAKVEKAQQQFAQIGSLGHQ